MPYYEIYYVQYGTALIEADNEIQAYDILNGEQDYDEAEIKRTFVDQPSLHCYDFVSLDE